MGKSFALLRRTAGTVFVCCGCIVAGSAQAAVGRTFVSTLGVDTNTSLNCSPTAPCRSFAAALSVTASGGQVVVLNSGGYGLVSIAQSVTITAPEGVFGGITVATGNGVDISYTGSSGPMSVSLRGLTINNVGGSAQTGGIYISSLAAGLDVNIENCVLSGAFPVSSIYATGPAVVRISGTTIRDAGVGIQIVGGATAAVSSSHVTFFGVGILAGAGGLSVTNATISDTVVADEGGAGIGFEAQAAGNGVVQMTVDRSTASDAAIGAESIAQSGTGNPILTLTNSTLSHNQVGVDAGGQPALLTLGQTVITSSITCGARGSSISTFGNNSFFYNSLDTCVGTTLVPVALK